MTGTDDSNSSTRPISVAELLAKNGTIGAPPVGGRRRRRRGNSDAVTVAELTGEIPIIRPDDPPPAAPVPAVEEQVTETTSGADDATETTDAVEDAEATEATEVGEFTDVDDTPEPSEGDLDDSPEADPVHYAEDVQPEDVHPRLADEADLADEDLEPDEAPEPEARAVDDQAPHGEAVAEHAARIDEHDVEPHQRTRRFGFGRFGRKTPAAAPAATSAPAVAKPESWTSDRPADLDREESVDELDEPVEIEEIDVETALTVDPDEPDADPDESDADELPSYLRSSEEPLFGGQSIADDLARRGSRPSLADDGTTVDAGSSADPDSAGPADDQVGVEPTIDEPRSMSPLVHGLWVVGQSIVAVIFGAAMFVAFDQLWKWNNIVALVLSVLVILGLVVGVRVVRKTEDIGSTLIAVAVGALVTLGPLALLQSG